MALVLARASLNFVVVAAKRGGSASAGKQKGLGSAGKGQLPVKICEVCGRPMEWRKSWAKNWEAVKYCSERCRRQRGKGAPQDGSSGGGGADAAGGGEGAGGKSQAYSRPATAGAFVGTIGDPRADHFRQLEAQTLSDALAELGIDPATHPSVLDVGCGEGRLVRQLAAAGARAVGCDASPAMVAAARAAPAAGGERYHCVDATSDAAVPPGAFDLVLSTYVLHMSRTEAELQAMCAFLSRHARPGGSALVLTVSGEYQPEDRQCQLMARCWGFTSRRPAPQAAPAAAGGSDPGSSGGGSSTSSAGAVEFVMGADGGGGDGGTGGAGEVRVLNWLWPEAVYRACLERAGFARVQRWPVRAPPGLLAWAEAQRAAAGAQAGAAAAPAPAAGGGAAPSDAERAELLLLYLRNPHVVGYLAHKPAL